MATKAMFLSVLAAWVNAMFMVPAAAVGAVVVAEPARSLLPAPTRFAFKPNVVFALVTVQPVLLADEAMAQAPILPTGTLATVVAVKVVTGLAAKRKALAVSFAAGSA